MKLYKNLSDAASAFHRKPKEVFAIISFNGQAYFVFRSNPRPEIATIIRAQEKIILANELRKNNSESTMRLQKLFQFMIEAKVPELFPESFHAEENLIGRFPEILEKFKDAFPFQSINKIDIFLTHSPCSTGGNKSYSSAKKLNSFFLPDGCNQKLIAFFQKQNFKETYENLFSSRVKVQVRFGRKFDSAVTYDETFIKEADPLMKGILQHI